MSNRNFFLRLVLLTGITGTLWLFLCNQLTTENVIKTTSISLFLSALLVLVRFNQDNK